jgi:hypothetical protein
MGFRRSHANTDSSAADAAATAREAAIAEATFAKPSFDFF